MNFDQFTERTQQTIATAIQVARDYANAQVHPAHIGAALLNEDAAPEGGVASGGQNYASLFSSVIQKAGGDTASPPAVMRMVSAYTRLLPSQSPPPDEVSFTGTTLKVLREATELQKTMHDSYVAQDHLILALIKDSTIAPIIKEAGLTEAAIKTAIQQTRGNRRIESRNAEAGFDALQKYAVDLTALAQEGKIDPVIGRDNEIRRVIRILCRRTKNNPVLIGEPGVGKTSIVEGLAQRIVNRDVPASLLGRIFSLDMGALMAGAKYKGEYEERIKNVLNEVEKSAEQGDQVILFIDELHLIMAGRGAEGGGMDAGNLFKPLLARGKLRCIGATTLAEYRKYIETDAALERRFAQVIVNEPTVGETINILRGIREKYEVHHGVRILDGALISAATLAHRYLTSRRLPDAAIDLVDEACASVRVTRETAPEAIDKLQRRRLELEVEIHALEREKDQASKERLGLARKAIAEVDDELQPLKAAYEAQKKIGDEINHVRKRVDELKAKADEAERRYDLQTASDLRYYALPELQTRLEQLLAKKSEAEANGQSGADTVTPEQIAEIVARWTAIPLATILFDSPDAMIRIDGSEYSEKHSIARLIGAPPGYVGHDAGGQLTEYVRRKPYCIVLIDEIEKASREFVTLFLQVLDDGRLTDGQGRVVDFRNTVIIMTSNLGAAFLNEGLGGRVDSHKRELVMSAIQAHFPPEFVNRIDEIIIFRALSRDNVLRIVDLRLKEVQERLAGRKITVNIEPEAKQYLASVGYNPAFGARPLNRAIQTELLNPLSVMLLSEQIQDNEIVHIKFDGPRNKLVIIPNHPGQSRGNEDIDLVDDDIEIEEMD
ncbi:hypothetical protein ID866_2517 [Astraeus odoratus]|nr:hypothetical protein ID866_2517 [Astraeus odoratus]